MTTDATPVRRTQQPDDTAMDASPLARFSLVALPTGWVLLTLPLVLHHPSEPYVLATLVLGLILPAVVLTRRDPTTTVRGSLLRGCWRPPRPAWLLAPALLLVPGSTWALGTLGGAAPRLDGQLLVSGGINLVSSLLIVNLWEEMVWAGFVQRRAMRRWGYLRGSLLTAVLFAGVHAALAFADAADVLDVARNAAILVGSAIGLRLAIGFLLLRAGDSILVVAVLHASFNAAALFVEPRWDWVRYLVIVVVGAAAAVGVRLSRRSEHVGSAGPASNPRSR